MVLQQQLVQYAGAYLVTQCKTNIIAHAVGVEGSDKHYGLTNATWLCLVIPELETALCSSLRAGL